MTVTVPVVMAVMFGLSWFALVVICAYLWSRLVDAERERDFHAALVAKLLDAAEGRKSSAPTETRVATVRPGPESES